MIKKCQKCGKDKPEEVFGKTKDKIDRKDTCKLCQFNWHSTVTSAIRRSFAKSPKVLEVLMAGRRTVPRFKKDGERHKVDAVQFQCQTCSCWFIRDLIEVDHVMPVVSVEEGFQNWNIFIDRIDCDMKNLQRICDDCHQKKSNDERNKRNALKDKLLLDAIEDQIKAIDTIEHAKLLIKQINKFTTKTKADVTKQRALELKIKLKDIIERQD